MDGWPDWVVKEMAKETRKTKPRDVKMPVDNISTRLPGKVSPPQAIEDGWYLLSDIKAGTQLECYIYSTSLDLAGVTQLLAEQSIQATITANQGTAHTPFTHYIDAGEVNGYPFLALEVLTTIETETQTVVGFTKVRAAVKGEKALACVHSQIGYRESFAKIFSDFVANTDIQGPETEPYYEEISDLNFNGLGSGISYYSFTEDEDGDTVGYVIEAALIAVDQNNITANDTLTISYITPDHELINVIDVEVENGELTRRMALQRNDEGTWIASGTFQGKEISNEIDGALSPATDAMWIAATRDLFQQETTSVTLDTWVPSIDPTRLLAATIQRDDEEVAGQAKISLGPLEYVGRFDTDGNLLEATLPMGPIVIDTKRLWSKGRSLR